MILPDGNILVHAHREDSTSHGPLRTWLEKALTGNEVLGLSDIVLSGFIRIVTHPRIFRTPTPLPRALEFAEAVRSAPGVIRVAPGESHWGIFHELCRVTHAKGNLVPDAYLAAIAIECGGEWITTDHDYARFPRLRWRNPLA